MDGGCFREINVTRGLARPRTPRQGDDIAPSLRSNLLALHLGSVGRSTPAEAPSGHFGFSVIRHLSSRAQRAPSAAATRYRALPQGPFGGSAPKPPASPGAGGPFAVPVLRGRVLAAQGRPRGLPITLGPPVARRREAQGCLLGAAGGLLGPSGFSSVCRRPRRREGLVACGAGHCKTFGPPFPRLALAVVAKSPRPLQWPPPRPSPHPLPLSPFGAGGCPKKGRAYLKAN